jgi:hypothetical protein
MEMNSLINAFGQISFLNLLWLFFLFFVIHELEEWNIDRFEHRHFDGLPAAATDRSARMWIGFVVLFGLVWILTAILPGDPALSAWIFLPAIAILVQNALQHLFWTVHFRAYAPGVVTAVLLLIPFGSYISVQAVQMSYVPAWYAAALGAFVLLGLAQTVRAGKRMTPLIQAINSIGIWLSDRIS